MGLDLVELVIRIEEEFGIDIPDPDAEQLTTPRQVADYVCSRLELVPAAACIMHGSFYRVRSAMESNGITRSSIKPATCFADVYPETERRRSWVGLKARLQCREWPDLRLPLLKPTRLEYPRGCETVGGLARHIATWDPRVPRGPAAPWSKETVWLRVRQITADELGIISFNDDDRYVQDLHAD